MEKENKCKVSGYHNWEVISVGGTLPNQELECECEECGLIHTFRDDFVN